MKLTEWEWYDNVEDPFENETSGDHDLDELKDELIAKMERDYWNSKGPLSFGEYFEMLEMSFGKIDPSSAEELFSTYQNYRNQIDPTLPKE